jgi:hypothetical protein
MADVWMKEFEDVKAGIEDAFSRIVETKQVIDLLLLLAV